MATINSSNTDVITDKTFDRYLNETLNQASTMRARVQIMIQFCISKALDEKRCDLSYLTRLYTALRGVKGINAKLVQRYICAALPVYWRESEGEVPAFVKTKKGQIELTELNCQWFEYEKDKKSAGTRALDVNKRVATLVDDLTDKINTHEAVKIDVKLLREQIRKLQELADRANAIDSK